MSSNHPPEIAKVDNIENNINEQQRKRKIISLNLLFNKSIATNVGWFLNFGKTFPKRTQLAQIFQQKYVESKL